MNWASPQRSTREVQKDQLSPSQSHSIGAHSIAIDVVQQHGDGLTIRSEVALNGID